MSYLDKASLKVVGTRPVRPDGVEKVIGRANFGAISGFFSSFSSFGLGAGPFIGAMIFDVTGAYRVMFIGLAGTYLATSLLLLFFVREPPAPTDGEREIAGQAIPSTA